MYMRYCREARTEPCSTSAWGVIGLDFDRDSYICEVGMNEFGDVGEETYVRKFFN